jgi:hypothetical protein
MENKPAKLPTRKKYTIEGRCASCGEFAYPYHYCHTCRIKRNVARCIRDFEKKGWVDVTIMDDGKKGYKWNNTAPEIVRKYTPESIAKMSLPRLKGKPMTENIIAEVILDVLNVNNTPLSTKEIERGFKSLKTIGKIIPESEQLVSEYKKIKAKESKLSKSQRDGVLLRIDFLLKKGAITQEQL